MTGPGDPNATDHVGEVKQLPAPNYGGQAEEAQKEREQAEHGRKWSPFGSRRSTIIFIIVVVAGLLLILWAWGLPPFRSDNRETDNAYVQGEVTVISPQVNGYVKNVLVQDFACVQAGQLLVKIDDSTYAEKVRQGDAQIAQQKATLRNSREQYREALAQIAVNDASIYSARANLVKTQADMRRAAELSVDGSLSKKERDQARGALGQAQGTLYQGRAQRASSVEQARSVLVQRDGLVANVEAAQAQRDQAAIDLSHTVIRAPRAGCLSEVGVRVGQSVQAGTQLMTLVPPEVWVVANFKEAQTAHMRVGQAAWVHVDALGGAKLKGRVERIAPATGSQFSVIKPDNGSGNFVKVAQRIAVRIGIDRNQDRADRLAPGMSVEATVDTGTN